MDSYVKTGDFIKRIKGLKQMEKTMLRKKEFVGTVSKCKSNTDKLTV